MCVRRGVAWHCIATKNWESAEPESMTTMELCNVISYIHINITVILIIGTLSNNKNIVIRGNIRNPLTKKKTTTISKHYTDSHFFAARRVVDAGIALKVWRSAAQRQNANRRYVSSRWSIPPGNPSWQWKFPMCFANNL